MPPDFRFLHAPLPQLAGVWFFGDLERHIVSYSQLVWQDIRVDAGSNERCRVASTMEDLQHIARANEIIGPASTLTSMDQSAVVTAVHAAYPLLIKFAYDLTDDLSLKRMGDRQVATIYNKLMQKKTEVEGFGTVIARISYS